MSRPSPLRPPLQPLPDIDLADYVNTLLNRFTHEAYRDQIPKNAPAQRTPVQETNNFCANVLQSRLRTSIFEGDA